MGRQRFALIETLTRLVLAIRGVPMTIRNLEGLFAPRSVAIIGASQRPGSLGAVVMENMLAAGFKGEVYPVNPKYRDVCGQRAFARVSQLPQPADLGVIVTPARTVPGIINELASSNARAACVISAGLGGGGDRLTRYDQMLQAARPACLRIVGPNCLGVQSPAHGLNASFAHLQARPGSIAFVSQSGAVLTCVLDWARPRGIGFSCVVSLGDMADVDFGDMLDYLANDAATRSILLYIEAITHPRKFMSAARAAARSKPVVVVKPGRHEVAARAAASHTGALAGSDGVYDAAFRRAGMLRVYCLEDLFDAVETLALAKPPRGERLVVLTNGGGMGVLAADALADNGLALPELSAQTQSKLDALLPHNWSRGNPVDIIGDADGARYACALEVLLEDTDFDAMLVLNCPTGVASSQDAAHAVAESLNKPHKKTVMTSWVGDHQARGSRQHLRERGIPTYDTPEDAAKAFAAMARYARSQVQLMQTPPSIPEHFSVQSDCAASIIRQVLDEKREWLSESEAKQALSAYGIATVPTHHAATPARVADIAKMINAPLAIKIDSPDLTHKSDIGGVALNVNPDNAADIAASMLERVQAIRPHARLRGVHVQPMIQRHGSREIIAGMINDRQFGPVLLIGHGGSAVEVLEDKALALPPLNLKLASEMIAQTRVSRLLNAYRNVPAANIDALALSLVQLSQLVIDRPEIEELDINPLLVDAQGVLALDARIRVVDNTMSGAQRLAIRPYPKELEEVITTSNGTELTLRPIVAEDENALRAGFARLTPQEVRYRFFVPMKLMDHITAARFTQIDYDRQMALVLAEVGAAGHTDIHGVVRLVEDPDRTNAEFAIIIERQWTGQGLGKLMLRRIIAYAHRRGIGYLFGEVLAENTRMLGLCRSLGFHASNEPNEHGVVRVSLELSSPGQITD